MAINTTTFESTLQTKLDDTTLAAKDMLLLGKALEATSGNIAVSDINAAGATKISEINTVATNTFKTVGGASILGSGDIGVSAGLKSQQVFTANGTWTKPAGINLIKVIVTGGGGGGGAPRDSNIPGYNGAGGGSAGTSIKIIDVSAITSVAVTIGAGGATYAPANVAPTGGTGGTSSFGAHCSASGGSGGWGGGSGSSTGGLFGVGSGGSLNIYGSCGDSASDTSAWESVAAGAPSFWGGGGRGSGHNDGSGIAAVAGQNGGGGGGGLGWNSLMGSAGGDGIVVVEEYS